MKLSAIGAAAAVALVSGAALAAPIDPFERAERALGIGAFEDAADSFELCGYRLPASPHALECMSRAASLRGLLEQSDLATADENALWTMASRASATSAKRDAGELAARLTVTLARRDGDLGRFDRALARVERHRRELERWASPELRAAAHGLAASAFEGLGNHPRARAEYAAVIALAKLYEGDGRYAWNEAAQDAAGRARLFVGDETKANADAVVLPPYVGRNDELTIRRYQHLVAIPWMERKMSVVEEAERAYARVLGFDIPRPPPPPQGAGDPNAPLALWAIDWDVGLARNRRVSAGWAVVAAARVGALWSDFDTTVGGIPITRDRNVEALEAYSGDAITRVRAKKWFTGCLSLSERHRVADATPCLEWLAQRYRADYHGDTALLPMLRDRGVLASYALEPTVR